MMADYTYVAVTNIPSDFHAADLRAHFSSFVESSLFNCFHFRHRPEKQQPKESNRSIESKTAVDSHNAIKRCCVVKIATSNLTKLLLYHGSNWTGADGNYLDSTCSLNSITLASQVSGDASAVDEDDLNKMPELNPPALMPNGNVGTPTLVFLDLVQQCLLPQTIVKKLQLKFPKMQGKRLYGNVDYDYHTSGSDDKIKALSRFPSSSIQSKALGREVKAGISMSKCSKSRFEIHKKLRKEQPNHGISDCDTRHSCDHNSSSMNHITQPGPSESLMQSSDSISSSKINELSCDDMICNITSKTDSEPKGNDVAKKPIGESAPIFKVPSSGEGNATMQGKPPSITAGIERKRREKAARRETRRLMAEGIEERLISIDKRYHNDEDAEEWDRHEASEDDPSNQERNTERLYEQEEETPWEKGGPGVVFYTDAAFWQAREGDFDEKTTDDLDVDFSAYEEIGAGDKDIKDFLKIRQEKRFREGYDKTDRYSIGIAGKKQRPSYGDHSSSDEEQEKPRKQLKRGKIGKFEHFTKGIGRRVMEHQGWRDGQGLGKSSLGIKDALRAEGQGPHNKSGLGYNRPALPVFQTSSSSRRNQDPSAPIISTAYDNPTETDPKVPLLQRSEPTTLKHRQSHIDSFSVL